MGHSQRRISGLRSSKRRQAQQGLPTVAYRSVGSIAELILRTSGLTLVFANIVLQVLDGATTFIAFNSGGYEINRYTLYLINLVGNGYVGVGIEKLGYIALCLFMLWLIRSFSRLKEGILRIVGYLLFDAFLLGLALNVAITVLMNLRTIGI